MTQSVPAYQQIKQYILQSIHSGLWRTGTAIPAETRLADQFSVSRMTVNRALKELSEEKVLERRQGSGTFVAQQQFNHTFVEVRNIADDIRQAGKMYHAKVIRQMPCQLADLSMSVQPLLQGIFHKKQLLFQLEVVHYADDIPIQYEKRWVDTEIAPSFSQQNFNHINASDYLIKNVPLVKGNYLIQAKLPSVAVADRLNMNNAQPALLITRYTYSNDNRVVTYVQMWHDGNGFQFSGVL